MVTKRNDPNYTVVRGHVPKKLAQRFKRYCVDRETDYSDGLEQALTFFLDRFEQEPLKERALNPLTDSQSIKATPQGDDTIPNLVRAYLSLTYRGTGSKQLQQMAKECEVSLEQIKAVLAGQPIEEEAAGVFAAKVKMPFGEFLSQYPVIRQARSQLPYHQSEYPGHAQQPNGV